MESNLEGSITEVGNSFSFLITILMRYLVTVMECNFSDLPNLVKDAIRLTDCG